LIDRHRPFGCHYFNVLGAAVRNDIKRTVRINVRSLRRVLEELIAIAP
jgi:RNase P protein component